MDESGTTDAFVEALREANRKGFELSSTAYRNIESTLRVVLGTYRTSTNEFDDLLHSVVIDVVRACHEGKVRFDDSGPATSHDNDATRTLNPRSFALTLATWRARDHYRRLEGPSQVRRSIEYVAPDVLEHLQSSRSDLPDTDDEVAHRLEQEASAALVQAALKIAREAQDRSAYIAASMALDMIEISGEMPTIRELGPRMGLSHTGARKALQRFRKYLEQARSDDLDSGLL